MTEAGKTVGGAIGLAAVLATAAGLAFWSVGPDPARRRAVALAAAAVGSGALAGWFVGRASRGRPAATAVAGSLGVTVVRLTPPLITLAWLTTAGGEALKAAGAGEWVVVFYLLLLATDVLATIIGGRKPGSRGGAGGGI